MKIMLPNTIHMEVEDIADYSLDLKLEDIEQIKIKNRPFNCQKLSIKIKNPTFYGMHEKKINKIRNVSIVADRKTADTFTQQMEHKYKS